MPLTTHYSHTEVIREFIAHWQGHEELDDLVLVSGVTLDALVLLKTSLEGAQNAVLEREVALSGASGQAEVAKRRLRKRLVEFNVAARHWLEGTAEGEMVPRVETFTAAPDKFCRPVREALRLWGVVNEGPAPAGLVLPLVLRGGFSRADMEGLRGEFDADRLAEEEAEFALGLARARRDVLEARVRRVLVSYNQMVMSQFGDEEIIAGTKPRLFPLPGSTPDAVELSGAWDAERNGAALSWEASTEPKVKGYQLRCHDGPEYRRRGSRVVRNFPLEGPHEYVGREALEVPGRVVSYCLYVVKVRGRHKGSKPLTVAAPRPVAG